MRKLSAAMKVSLDQRVTGPQGYADWVEAWSEDYGLSPQIDACLLGGGMYPEYETYWTALQKASDRPLPMTGTLPLPAELAWARFIPQTTHYVLSTTLTTAGWPNTRFVRGLEDIAALKRQSGKDIYLVGGARTTGSLIEAGLVDEIRLIVYPLIAGEGKTLFAATGHRRPLALRKTEQLPGGRVTLTYSVGPITEPGS